MTIATGRRETIVDVRFAVSACETGRAGTNVAVDAVVARGSVFAWLGHAIVDVNFAPTSREAREAVAVVLVDSVVTQGAIQARIAGTFVDVHFAIHARISWKTKIQTVS